LRVEKGKLIRQIMIINLIIHLRAVEKIMYVKSILKIVELQKKLFVKDAELGQEIFIPSRFCDI
jgi:hypothetical protein